MQAIGEHAAAIPQVGQAGFFAGWAYKAGEQQVSTHTNQSHNGDDLDQGKPELQLAKQFGRQQVKDQQEGDTCQAG